MELKEKKALIESLLFVSGEPLTVAVLKNATELAEDDLKRVLDELSAEYRERDGGVVIMEIAGGYQMVTNPNYSQWIRKLRGAGPASKLSMAALETLAIVAYNQPIIKAELEQMRGVSSDGVVRTLLEKRLIKIVGRKEMPGKPLLYGTTREFLEYFGLKDLSELPTLKELAREEAA